MSYKYMYIILAKTQFNFIDNLLFVLTLKVNLNLSTKSFVTHLY